MRRFLTPFLLLALALPACEDELFDSGSDDDRYYGNGGSSETYTITIVSERYDVVDVRLDGRYKGTLVRYGSRLEFTASGGEHRMEFWGTAGGIFNPEEVLIAGETFILDEDMEITLNPL